MSNEPSSEGQSYLRDEFANPMWSGVEMPPMTSMVGQNSPTRACGTDNFPDVLPDEFYEFLENVQCEGQTLPLAWTNLDPASTKATTEDPATDPSATPDLENVPFPMDVMSSDPSSLPSASTEDTAATPSAILDQEISPGGTKLAKGQLPGPRSQRGLPARAGQRSQRQGRQRAGKVQLTAREGRGRDPCSGRQQSTESKTKQRTAVLECDLLCEVCNKRYKTREYLTKHRRSTHENKKMKCKICTSEFGEKTDLNRHIRTKHHMNPKYEPLDEDVKDRCDFSNCKFATYRGADKLKEHMMRIHRGAPVLACRLTRGNRNPKPCKFICYTERVRKQHERRLTAGHTSQAAERLFGTPDE